MSALSQPEGQQEQLAEDTALCTSDGWVAAPDILPAKEGLQDFGVLQNIVQARPGPLIVNLKDGLKHLPGQSRLR